MQAFFNQEMSVQHQVLVNSNWSYARDGLLANIEKAVDYYTEAEMAVPSQHLLCRLLNSIGVDQRLALERYYNIVDAKALGIARTFKMTSSLSVGAIFSGIFYGSNSKEILIGHNEEFDPFVTSRDWKDAAAITVLASTQSDLSLLLPDGKNITTKTGVTVLAINIPMLAVQYRSFCEEQAEALRMGGNALTTAHFVHMFVLPHMLESQTNIALFNRLNCFLTGSPVSETTGSKHPFYLTDYEAQVDRFYTYLLTFLSKIDRNFDTVLNMIPMLNDTLAETMRLPDYISTRQIFWAETIARLDCVDFLTDISPHHGTKLNRQDTNYFLREFNSLRNGSILNSAPADIRYETQAKIDEIRAKIS